MVRTSRSNYLYSGLAALFLFASCTKDVRQDTEREKLYAACYPDAVGKIIINKCSVAGCHNTQSKDGAGGLDLTNWTTLFQGANGGSAVIPYSTDQSFLVNFINTDSTQGPVQLPSMPYNSSPLSFDEVKTIKDWINDGAPDCRGARLTDNPDRKKFYITNQGCDLVSVWDADSVQIMRYVKVGANEFLTESPHSVKISPDGNFWYVSFVANGAQYLQKYRTSDDTFVAQVDITLGSWNTFAFTPDSKWVYVIDFNSNGRIAIVDCDNMTLRAQTPFNPDAGFTSPHGSAISPDGHYLYVTLQLGDALYKMDITSFPPDGQFIQFNSGTISKPHEVAFSPDGTLYFVTCEGTNDVKVFKTSNDQFLKSIPVGNDPVEMSFSHTTNNLFVTCMAGNAVSIINYVDTVLVKTISTPGTFYYPHGVGVDDAHGVCYIVNRNLVASGGPPPHHTSICGGRNGYLLEIDLHTLDVISGFKDELSVDPYTIAIRK